MRMPSTPPMAVISVATAVITPGAVRQKLFPVSPMPVPPRAIAPSRQNETRIAPDSKTGNTELVDRNRQEPSVLCEDLEAPIRPPVGSAGASSNERFVGSAPAFVA